MHTKERISKEKDFHSENISTQIRIVAMGLLITIWGFLIRPSNVTFTIDSWLEKNLLLIGFYALLVLFFDFLQYLFGYANNNTLFNTMEKENKGEIQYNYKNWRYIGQGCCFKLKISLIILSFIYFVAVIIPYLIK